MLHKNLYYWLSKVPLIPRRLLPVKFCGKKASSIKVDLGHIDWQELDKDLKDCSSGKMNMEGPMETPLKHMYSLTDQDPLPYFTRGKDKQPITKKKYLTQRDDRDKIDVKNEL